MSKIQDGVYAYIGGTVVEARHGKTGMYLWVDVQRDGAKYPDRITVWGLTGNISFNKGDRIKAKGWLSWQRNESAEGKIYLNVSMNKPEIVEHETSYALAQQERVTAEQVAADILGATPIDDSAPF